MRNAILSRLNHLRSIAKWWWAVALTLWSSFWVVDQIIQKWGSPHLIIAWKSRTEHLPARWEIWLIGLLVITVLLVIEGSFRQHIKTAREHAAEIECHAREHNQKLTEASKGHASDIAERDAEINQLRSESQQNSQQTWSTQWDELAARFEKLSDQAFAEHNCHRRNNATVFEEWRIGGSDPNGYCETLCKRSGVLLLKSPQLLKTLSESTRSQSDPFWRWCYFLKENHRTFTLDGALPPVGHDGTIYMHGRIWQLAPVSARVCLDCAAQEL